MFEFLREQKAGVPFALNALIFQAVMQENRRQVTSSESPPPTVIPMSSHNAQARRAQQARPSVARSKSFLGVIKDLVTAPLAWLTDNEGADSGDINGKRRRPVHSNSRDESNETGASRSKKPRIGSPDRQVGSAYLDPPGEIFQQPGRSQFLQPNPSFSSNSPYRSSSVFTPSTKIHRPPHNRHSVSPLVSTSNSRKLSVSRTMSTDLTNAQGLTRDVIMLPISREPSMNASFSRDSMPRDLSSPVARTPFRMRTSLTPQPSGVNFGPRVKSRERDPSEPPPLMSLMSNPIFVKAPSETPQQRSTSAQPVVTLGSVLESQRSNQLHKREYSSLFGTNSGPTPKIPNGYHPINAAEKALHELDVYKTPLLPSRLKTVSTLPDMFKPKKSHNLVLMHEREEKARLGVSRKKRGKAAEEINGTKPYAGVGGMKKLLARRKMEEEQEKEKDASEAMEADIGEAEEDRNAKTPAMNARVEPDAEKIPPIPPPMSNASSRAASRERSSLRVGRTKTSRSHLSRPAARPVNRFSARYEEEEGDDQMGEDSGKGRDFFISDEAAERVPVLNVPSSFSFANETVPVQHDLSNAKEPPITTLPFSLSSSNDKPISSLPSVKESVERPAASVFGTTGDYSTSSFKVGSAATSLFSTAPPAPSTVVTPPAPEQAQALPAVSTAPEGTPASIVVAPNIFSKPSLFPKSDVSITPSIFGGPTPPVPIKDAENPLWEGEKVAENANELTPSAAQPAIPPSEPKPPVFGGFEKQATVSVFGSVNNTSSSSSSHVAPPMATSSPLPDASIIPTIDTESETTSITLFGTAPKPAEPNVPSFSFAAPAKPADPPATNQPVFTFGVTKIEPPKEPKSVDNITPNIPVPPPMFGGSSDATSLFKAPQKPVELVAETPKPSFSFGSSTPAPVAPTIEQQAAKSPSASGSSFLFGAQESGSQAGFTSSSPFSYGAAPSTPPAGADKKPLFTFGPSTTPALAPAFSSGASTGNGGTGDVSSKFVFGAASTPTARPVTPPKNEDQECRMEESPTRDMQLNGIGKQAVESRPSLFSFAPIPTTTTPFGQSNQSSSTPFTFNAPSTNFFSQKIETKPEQKPALTFGGFGQNQASNAFGQKPAEIDQSKNSTSPFSFQPSPTTSAGPSFAFRAPATNNPFSQANQQGGSAPNSPSFNQNVAFPFSTPAPTSAPFSFHSTQPASPATANNVNLPSTATPGMFSFGASATPQPSSFGAPAQAPPPGGTLFTIGAPPSAPPGGRQVKRLPIRRGNKR